MTRIGIILGSTRPNRFGVQPAQWLTDVAKKTYGDKAEFELIDLAEINLPLLDEPTPPLMRQYTKEHTKQWSALIDSFDGFLIVTAEYDHSVPAALKNALDYLFHEWNYKPVAFASYGSLAGGARAVEHLRGIAGEVKMYDLREQLLLPDYWNNIGEDGAHAFSEEQSKTVDGMLSQLVYWAEVMKPAREKLAADNA